MGYTARPETLDHLVALIHEQRPNWDQGLTRLILLDLARRVDGTDLAIAALRAACAENLPSPKAIGWRGPHWDGLTPPPEIRHRARCNICGKTEPRCWGERPGPDDHTFEPVELVTR